MQNMLGDRYYTEITVKEVDYDPFMVNAMLPSYECIFLYTLYTEFLFDIHSIIF